MNQKNILCLLSLAIMILTCVSGVLIIAAYPNFADEHYGLSCIHILASALVVVAAGAVFLMNHEPKSEGYLRVEHGNS